MFFNIQIKSTPDKDETLWLDIRGNHDTFNVKSDEADNNFFRRFGVQGPSRRRSYTKTVNLDGKWDYSFVGQVVVMLRGRATFFKEGDT